MMLGRAFEMAFRAHAGQTDKSGTPYAHVVRVAAGVDGEMAQVVGLLHDVVEDCDTTLAEVEAAFGAEVATAVDAITKRAGEANAVYLIRVAANPLARRVKLSDIADNSHPVRLALLDQPTQDRLREKYAEAHAALSGD